MRILTCALTCAAFSVAPAEAEPGGTQNVYGPTVEAGERELDLRSAYFSGGELDGALRHRAEAGYALTDWWRPAIVLKIADSPGTSSELTAVAIENVIDFAGTRSWPVHFGGYAEYSFGQNGRSDSVELKLLAERHDGPLLSRLNLIGERALGDSAPDEWEHAYAVRVTWQSAGAAAIGVEGFGEPEAGAHYWGPRAVLSVGGSEFAIAYLVGLDNAQADGQVRLAIELEH